MGAEVWEVCLVCLNIVGSFLIITDLMDIFTELNAYWPGGPFFGLMVFDRVCSENQALSKRLEERTKEMQTLKTENTCEYMKGQQANKQTDPNK